MRSKEINNYLGMSYDIIALEEATLIPREMQKAIKGGFDQERFTHCRAGSSI